MAAAVGCPCGGALLIRGHLGVPGLTDSNRLADCAWPQIDEGRLVVVVPLGSMEQHGPHLPLDTDTRIAEVVAAALVAATPSAVLAPSVAYGASGEHEGFPGTVSVGTEALTQLLVELGRSMSRWTRRVLLVSGHGGNAEALRSAVNRLRDESHEVAWWPCSPGADALTTLGGSADSHAGRVETSLMLHLAPDTVDLDLAEAGNRRPLKELLPRLRASSVAAVSGNGVLGDPAGASPGEGAMLLADMVTRVSAATAAWRPDQAGRLA